MLENKVVGYQVIVNRLEHSPGTRDVVQSGVYSRVTETKDASVSGLGNEYILLYVQRLASMNHTCMSMFLQLVRFPTASQ